MCQLILANLIPYNNQNLLKRLIVTTMVKEGKTFHKIPKFLRRKSTECRALQAGMKADNKM
jgi:hypothetical protein